VHVRNLISERKSKALALWSGSKGKDGFACLFIRRSCKWLRL